MCARETRSFSQRAVRAESLAGKGFRADTKGPNPAAAWRESPPRQHDGSARALTLARRSEETRLTRYGEDADCWRVSAERGQASESAGRTLDGAAKVTRLAMSPLSNLHDVRLTVPPLRDGCTSSSPTLALPGE